MTKMILAAVKEEDGVLSFEWTMLVTLLTIGIVGGLAGARDAIIDELGDVSQAMLAVDQSYTVDFPLSVNVHVPAAALDSSASNSEFIDAAVYTDCLRATSPTGQGPQADTDS